MVAAVAAMSVAAGAFGRHFYGWATRESNITSKVESALNLATAALAKLELFSRELADHRIEDARQFARIEAMASEASRAQVNAEGRMTRAIEEVGDKLDAMGVRLDRFLEHRD